MLVVRRRLNETIIIDDTIRVTIIGICHKQVRLGFEAPDRIRIYREERMPSDRPVARVEERPAQVPSTSQPGRPGQ